MLLVFAGVPFFFIAALVMSYDKEVEIDAAEDLVQVQKGTFFYRSQWKSAISALREVGIVTAGGKSHLGPPKTLYIVVLRGDPGVMIPGNHPDLEEALEIAQEIAEETGLPLNEKPTLPFPFFWK